MMKICYARRGVRAAMNDDVIVTAMAEYLGNSLEQERVLRELLEKVGYNDPERAVEDCVSDLVIAHLRLVSST